MTAGKWKTGLVANRRRRNHIARAIGVHGRDHASHLHGFDHARGAVVADLQFALHRGNRGTPAVGDKAYGFIVERIVFTALPAFAPAAAATVEAAAGLFDTIEDVVDIVRRATQFPGFHQAVHFFVGHK